jgi:hypothetical protein
MPSFARFANGLWSRRNKIAIYTALLVGENTPAFRFLLQEGRDCVDYIMASFHPEAEEIEDQWFHRLTLLKAAGHAVIFRFVGHPDRLDRLPALAARCRELDIAFHPTPLFSPDYPAAYTPEERRKLEDFAVSLSQIIQLEGGIDTTTARCTAGSALIYVDMRTGNILPCATVDRPLLGNLYDNTLNLMPGSIACPRRGITCLCDIHFQQDVVHGADDRENFEAEKRGYVAPKDAAALREAITSRQLRFSEATPRIGQTATAAFMALDNKTVKAAYESNRAYLVRAYAEGNHSAFKSRQLDAPPAAAPEAAAPDEASARRPAPPAPPEPALAPPLKPAGVWATAKAMLRSRIG